MGSSEEHRFFDTTRFTFILRGILVGLLSGLVVSVFRLLCERGLQLMTWVYGLMHHHLWLLLPVILGALVITLINGRLITAEPNIKGSGIPQVEGQLSGDLEMNWWSVLWRKWIGGILGISYGLFLGREGPSIQLGATVGQGIADSMKKKGAGRRVLIAGGAAAGLSAAFNAPIASTLFVLEEVYHNFSPLVWTTALAAAVSSNFVSMEFFGLTPVLDIHYGHSFPLRYYVYLVVMGVILGLLGYLYQYMTLNGEKVYAKLKLLPRKYDVLIPLLMVIAIGYFWPHLLGGGNGLIKSLGTTNPTLLILLAIFIMRLLFSTISYCSGTPGGIFLPILALGAVLGALYGEVLVHLHLMPTYLVANCVIYAMAGYFACIGKAPFTAILLITEMVGSLRHLMPLAVVSLTAYTVVDILRGQPIYEAMLANLRHFPQNAISETTQEDEVEIPVFAGSNLQDKQVRDIPWPKDCLLAAIRRGEKERIPHGDTVIRSGDTLIVVTPHENRAWLRNRLHQYAVGRNNKGGPIKPSTSQAGKD
ncbi:ClC family H(+)/Cl(-) exchange transporter [Ligilactobacillus hohenheimensis]|uniref:ClC family H(+)/Cl(-) exchange transporter n=1 Tax=Ligilactobacillus hohenheimensis TaxID=2991832 RepID=UPI0024B9DF3B|nr:ClC family H(+)/Cl(-) exchange transporter [Ligilactobacillus hohenheimensis]